MKKLLNMVLASLMFLSLDAVAQESIISEINYADLQKYVNLAKKNFPRKKMWEAQKEASKAGIPMAQVSYLDMFNANYFYRPEDRAVLDPINPYNVNGFQFSINFNLGNYLQKPFQVKKAKAEYKVAQFQADEYELELEREVKTRYYDYILQISKLKINTQTAQDNKGVAENLRSRFERGEITIDAYNQSRIAVSASSAAKIQVEIEYLKAKDALEEIIGEKLAEIK
ncbi:TolC family protein [Pedobacter sp. ASV1-7]|uniref:TolC family protein n=1 Tax=Pedobacter sp. ASV1-7 TaxID=3145237 RepID=UPI0032E8C4D6